MKENLKATTRRMIPILAQIVQCYLPGYKIEEIDKGEKIKAREFSYSAQVHLLMLGQLAHVFSLNELVDLSTIFSGELRRIRGIEAVKLTTFSHANRTRNPGVMQKFFQTLRGVFFVIREKEPTKYRVVRRTPKKDLSAGIISDETIRLSASIA